LQRRVATPDDWTRNGRLHPHWDDRSDPPMASWHRVDLVDLVDSSYAPDFTTSVTCDAGAR
jgi:hypothetical protein